MYDFSLQQNLQKTDLRLDVTSRTTCRVVSLSPQGTFFRQKHRLMYFVECVNCNQTAFLGIVRTSTVYCT